MQGHWRIIITGALLTAMLVVGLFIGTSAQGFGTTGVSSRELPKGLCVLEIDESIDGSGKTKEVCQCIPSVIIIIDGNGPIDVDGFNSQDLNEACFEDCPENTVFCGNAGCVAPEECNAEACDNVFDDGEDGFFPVGLQTQQNNQNGICNFQFQCVDVGVPKMESFDLVITETGRKPAFAVVDRLIVYGQDEILEQDNGGLVTGQKVHWHGKVKTMARTLNNIITGVPEKTAVFPARDALSGPGTSFANLLDDFPIASQGQAGEIRTRLTAASSSSTTFDFHIVAVLESPVGNLCSMNLIPVKEQPFCGNGKLDPGEQCEPPNSISEQCGGFATSVVSTSQFCGPSCRCEGRFGGIDV